MAVCIVSRSSTRRFSSGQRCLRRSSAISCLIFRCAISPSISPIRGMTCESCELGILGTGRRSPTPSWHSIRSGAHGETGLCRERPFKIHCGAGISMLRKESLPRRSSFAVSSIPWRRNRCSATCSRTWARPTRCSSRSIVPPTTWSGKTSTWSCYGLPPTGCVKGTFAGDRHPMPDLP